MKKILSTLTALVLLANLQTAFADDSYRGVLKDQGRSVAVSLTLNASKSASPAGQIRFGEPWACSFALEFVESENQQDLYNFKGAGAGRCLSLTLGYFKSQVIGEGLGLELYERGGNSLYTLELLRQAQ